LYTLSLHASTTLPYYIIYCGRCWLDTPLWPSNLSLDGSALVASVQSAPSEFSIRLRSMPDITTKVSLAWGARWRWKSLVPRDPPTPSQSPCYRSLVPTMGGCQVLGPSCPSLGLRGGRGARLSKLPEVSSLEMPTHKKVRFGCQIGEIRYLIPFTLQKT